MADDIETIATESKMNTIKRKRRVSKRRSTKYIHRNTSVSKNNESEQTNINDSNSVRNEFNDETRLNDEIQSKDDEDDLNRDSIVIDSVLVITNGNDNDENSEDDGTDEIQFRRNYKIRDDPDCKSDSEIYDEISLRNSPSTTNRNSTVIDAVLLKTPEVYVSEEKTKFVEEEETYIVREMVEEKIVYNEKFLSKHSETYEVENFDQNVMYIFNQIHVNGYKPRRGTEHDVRALTECFSNLGFKIHVFNDYDKNNLFQTLDEASKSNFTSYGCISVVVLTHGSRGGYLYAKDRDYHESELMNFFKTDNKPTLITKPKLFIIQAISKYLQLYKKPHKELFKVLNVIIAINRLYTKYKNKYLRSIEDETSNHYKACRGTAVTKASIAGKASQDRISFDSGKEPEYYTLPSESDILLVHSTYAGSVAHREELNGSWFVQSLCRAINELAHEKDLETIITEVLKDVAINKQNELYNRITGQYDINKQMPVKTSTLIRKLYFNKNLKEHNITAIDTYSNIEQENNLIVNVNGSFDPIYEFKYFKRVLRIFCEDNPSITLAYSLLNIANSIKADDVSSYAVRESTLNEIKNYLRMFATHWKYYDMIYFIYD